MERKSINDAVDNISYIKNIIEQTKESFYSLSKIFILWSILFIVQSIWSYAFSISYQSMNSAALINLSVTLMFVLLAAGIYIHISRKTPLLGLERQVLFIWTLILLISFLPSRYNFNAGDSYYVITRMGHYTTLLCGLGIALIITKLFTNHRIFAIVGAVYIGLGFLFSMFDIQFLSYLQYVILPITFLYTGLSLKKYSCKEQI